MTVKEDDPVAPNTGEQDEVSSMATMKASNVTAGRTSMVWLRFFLRAARQRVHSSRILNVTLIWRSLALWVALSELYTVLLYFKRQEFSVLDGKKVWWKKLPIRRLRWGRCGSKAKISNKTNTHMHMWPKGMPQIHALCSFLHHWTIFLCQRRM